MSWLKGMKGRLSAILRKPPKEKEKNLQSTATEKRFSSLSLKSETADKQIADAELLQSVAAAGIGGKETVAAIYALKDAGERAGHSAAAAAKAFVSLGNALNDCYKYPERATNNWLKMHGFPMRRKGKGRKRRE